MSRLAILLAAGTYALSWIPMVERLGAQERGPIGIPMFRVAPKAIAAEVDGAAVSIFYSPPSMQGRTIFGGEVPYGSAWCVGADSCARFATDQPLRFDDLVLDAGEYSLWIVPTRDIWTLIFNSNSRGARQQRYNPGLNVGSTSLRREMLSSAVEQLTFTIQPNQPRAGGSLAIAWETIRASAAFTVGR